MPKKFRTSLFIFRRDLRLCDNTALIRALQESDRVITCFVFDPRQTADHPYHSSAAFAFMLDCLRDLSDQLRAQGGRLCLFEGLPHEIVERLIPALGLDAVFINEDYTPFSVERDRQMARVCEARQTVFVSCADALLHHPRAIAKQTGGPYTVFTPFFNRSLQEAVAKPAVNEFTHFYTGTIDGECTLKSAGFKPSIQGGRSQALRILKDLSPFKQYERDRDLPAESLTTHLSAHHKFGSCSVRETYWAVRAQLGAGHTLIKELYWRDFFTHIGHHFPHVFGHSFYDEYDGLQWSSDETHFKAWCEGRTGFPIVDAGMRELNATGFMHNRVRMITASFLVKDLHIDWRKGERYFATKLVDYDPCVNNGNWQWAASTGCDHQPYFRIFNPWLQQKRFDAEARYIRRWVTELKDLDPAAIHRLVHEGVGGYPRPIVIHGVESQKAKDMFKSLKG